MALVTPDSLRLWLHIEKVTPELLAHLQSPWCEVNSTCVQLSEVSEAVGDLSSWVGSLSPPQKILLTKASMYLSGASYAVYEAVPKEFVELGDSSVLDAKAVKNEV